VGDSNVRGFSGWDLLALAFAQLSYRESLHDIEACLQKDITSNDELITPQTVENVRFVFGHRWVERRMSV
jgi:hypothetical protein